MKVEKIDRINALAHKAKSVGLTEEEKKESEIEKKIKEVDPLQITPLEALNILYDLKKEDELISIAVILHIDRKTLELKNIVTKENYRNKGYAKTLLKSLCGNYKQKYDRMLVGTTENNIPFYVKQGFDKYEKTVKNFFIDNYNEEIKDGDLICTDLIYYSKDLKKKESWQGSLQDVATMVSLMSFET